MSRQPKPIQKTARGNSRPSVAINLGTKRLALASPPTKALNPQKLVPPGGDQPACSDPKEKIPHYMRSTASSRSRQRVVDHVKSSETTGLIKLKALVLNRNIKPAYKVTTGQGKPTTTHAALIAEDRKSSVVKPPLNSVEGTQPPSSLATGICLGNGDQYSSVDETDVHPLSESMEELLQDELPEGATALNVLKRRIRIKPKSTEYCRENRDTKKARAAKEGKVWFPNSSNYGSLPSLASSTPSPCSSPADFRGLSLMFNGEHRWWMGSTSSGECVSDYSIDFAHYNEGRNASDEELDQDGQERPEKENEEPVPAILGNDGSKNPERKSVPSLDQSVAPGENTPSSDDGAFYTPQGKVFHPPAPTPTPVSKLCTKLRSLNFTD